MRRPGRLIKKIPTPGMDPAEAKITGVSASQAMIDSGREEKHLNMKFRMIGVGNGGRV